MKLLAPNGHQKKQDHKLAEEHGAFNALALYVYLMFYALPWSHTLTFSAPSLSA